MTLTELQANLLSILPLAVLVVWALALLLIDLFIPANRKGLTALLSFVGLMVSLGLTLMQFSPNSFMARGQAFNGMIVIDGYSQFLNVLFLLSGMFAIGLSYDYLKRMGLEKGEFYILLLLSVAGMLLMSMAADLIIVFLSLEWFSIPLYIMAGFAQPRTDSEESALKYFLLGAYATSIIVYGTALVYGATATTSLVGILRAVQAETANLGLLTVGGALVLVGLGFKVSAAPFHMWTPDVYHGAPSPVSGFMSVTAKAAGFAALLRVFIIALPATALNLTPIIWALAALTMFVGNIVAIVQNHIKRLLAYSSIAHAGYLMMALVVFGQARVTSTAVAAVMFYLVAYALTSFGAWAVVIALEKEQNDGESSDKGLLIDDYAGLGRKKPFLAAAMAVFMLSFIGIPPTLGFVGKFYLFRLALEGGYLGLALVGVITSLISAYYYLRVVVVMYMKEGEPEIRQETWLNLTVFSTAAAVVLLSIFSTPLFDWASRAMISLF